MDTDRPRAGFFFVWWLQRNQAHHLHDGKTATGAKYIFSSLMRFFGYFDNGIDNENALKPFCYWADTIFPIQTNKTATLFFEIMCLMCL